MFSIILFIILIGKLPPQYMGGNFWIFLIVDIVFATIEIVVVVLAIIYRRDINSNTPTIKLKTFLSLYRVDPSRWHLEYNGVTYYSKDGHYTYAKFANYFDYHMYKYLSWRRKINEDKVNALKTQADFVKQLQSDLTLTREEIDELIKKELNKCVDEVTD